MFGGTGGGQKVIRVVIGRLLRGGGNEVGVGSDRIG